MDLALSAARDGRLDAATGERFVGYVNMARTAIERVCLDTIELVERSVGVRGLLAPHPIERLVRDLTIYLRQPVPDAALTDAGRYALESTASGTATTWKNPDSGHSGAVTPKRTYQTASGQYCREYTQTINVGGKKQQSYGTACRQPDGQWKIVS